MEGSLATTMPIASLGPPATAAQTALFKDFMASNGLPLAGHTLEGAMLQFVGPQSPQVWRTLAALLLEDLLGEDRAAEMEIGRLSDDELVKLTAAIWKKIPKDDRERVFKQFIASSGAAVAARQSVGAEPSPAPRAPRVAAQEARQTIQQLIGSNDAGGPMQMPGQRRRGTPSPSDSSSSTDSDRETDGTKSDKSEASKRHSSKAFLRKISFRNPKILLDPFKWGKAFQHGETIGDLQHELLAQLGVNKLRISRPNEWTTELAESLVELLLQWVSDSSDFNIPTTLVEILFRCKLYGEGASKEGIEEAIAIIRGEKMPKSFRRAFAKAKKSQGKRPARSLDSKMPDRDRIPKEKWDKMSQEERQKVLDRRAARRK